MGKTLLARACAAQTKACYLKLIGLFLVQMFMGDGPGLVRDVFELAKEKAPAVIFIVELDTIRTKRFDSEKSGDREVQRTMSEGHQVRAHGPRIMSFCSLILTSRNRQDPPSMGMRRPD
jgi:ATP-dependent 26S proteasome regulatory subunit